MSTSLRRLLLSGGAACPYGCVYCFERFPEYEPAPSLDDVLCNPDLLCNVDLVYPNCDSDFFSTRGWLDNLISVVRLCLHVSISTKAALSEANCREAADAIAANRSDGQVVKIAVSFSAWRSARQLEPRTPTPELRVRTLRHLSESGIPTAVTLKPILPDVPIDEYIVILEKTRQYCRYLLVGDEWVSPSSPRMLLSSVPSTQYSEAPSWTALPLPLVRRRSSSNHAMIVERALSTGFEVFESDLDLMGRLVVVDGQTTDE